MSGPTIDLVPARLTHVGPIASRMREADRIECRALGRAPKEALRYGLLLSLEPVTVLINGRAEAMLGVYPENLIGGVGIPWMLGTKRLYEHPRGFVEIAPHVVAAMQRDFPRLWNLVSVENKRAIRFLTWAGFSVSGPVEMHGGVAFVPFRRHRAIQAEPVAA